MAKKKPRAKPGPKPSGRDAGVDVLIDAETKAILERLAADENFTVAALVRDLITAALVAAPLAHSESLRVSEWIKFQVRLAGLPNRLIEGD